MELSMITVNFEGNSYLLSKSSDGGRWVGSGGPRGGRYPGLHCSAPRIIWPMLLRAAIEQGYEAADLRCNPVVKDGKPRKTSAKKSKNNSISIF